MAEDQEEYIVPVISEELHAETVPVETGTVRVVKRVEAHEEILEQELRRGRVEIKRVRTERIVDGPQQPRRTGRTLIVPVVSERLRVVKEWVVTEEIHMTQIEEVETARESVTVNHEVAEVQRLDEDGNVQTVPNTERTVLRPLDRASMRPRHAESTVSNTRPILGGGGRPIVPRD